MLIDLYVLAPERSVAVINRFLDHFLPHRVESAENYVVPEYSDNPSIVFARADEVIQYSVGCQSAAQSIYWRGVGDGEAKHAHVFFLTDGSLILGLSITETTESRCNWWLKDLKQFMGSVFGYYVCETPPTSSAMEFKRYAEAALEAKSEY